MERENVQERRRLPRCGVCRLPAETLAEVERERLAWGLTYDELAQRLHASGHRTSSSSLRRHLRNHVRNSEFLDGEAAAEKAEDVTTPFDALIGGAVDDRAIADATVRVLVEHLQSLEKTRRATRDRFQAERLTTRSLKEIAALDRALKRWEEVRKPRQELLAKLTQTLDRIPDVIGQEYQAFMSDHLNVIDRAVDEHLRDYSYPDRLVRRLNEAKADLRQNFGPRMITAIRSITQETLDALR